MFNIPPQLTENQIRNILRIPISFEKLKGRPLLSINEKIIEELWHHPAALVAHDNKDDPVFFYGNAVALNLFERDFTSFTQIPSRLSAEPLMRKDRDRLLKQVHTLGIIEDYKGIRISASGKRFLIQNATVWNLFDEHECISGQAALFSEWSYVERG